MAASVTTAARPRCPARQPETAAHPPSQHSPMTGKDTVYYVWGSRKGSTGASTARYQTRQNRAARVPARTFHARYPTRPAETTAMPAGSSHFGKTKGVNRKVGPTDQVQYLPSVRNMAPVKCMA